jgi:fucose 4-O-acetylase-like acetyltransferase
MSARERLVDIDIAKGLAIFLVVVGHVVARDYRPQGNEWFLDLRAGLYHFHMAFFFYLAGYVYFTVPEAQFGARLKRAFARMAPAYLLVALLGYAAKWALVRYVPVDRPVQSFWNDWLGLLLYPTSGFITFVWFIVALLLIYLATLVVARLLPGRPLLWLLVAAVLHLAAALDGVTEMFGLEQVARYWLIFMIGRWALTHRDRMLSLIRHTWWIWLIALCLSVMSLPRGLLFTVPGLLCIPALHGAALWIAEHRPRLRAACAWLGEASWPIYLFNAFAIGAVKALILKTFGWDGDRFIIALPLITAGGLLLPVLAQRLVLSRLPALDRVTR